MIVDLSTIYMMTNIFTSHFLFTLYFLREFVLMNIFISKLSRKTLLLQKKLAFWHIYVQYLTGKSIKQNFDSNNLQIIPKLVFEDIFYVGILGAMGLKGSRCIICCGCQRIRAVTFLKSFFPPAQNCQLLTPRILLSDSIMFVFWHWGNMKCANIIH